MGLRIATGLVLLVSVAPATALAEQSFPRGSRIQIPQLVGPALAAGAKRAQQEQAGLTGPTPSSRLIFLNRCAGSGCTLFGSFDEDSRTNNSSIVAYANLSQAHIDPLSYTDSQWNTVVECVRAMYAPFNVQIVTTDPGNVPHWEHIVAGVPQDVGMEDGVGGVSPWTGNCYPDGIIDNAITFTFAEVYGSSSGALQSVCETVAQETAHAWGFDHEFHCPDPMTYLGGCGDKEFRDVDVACGEYSARNCCDSSQHPTQNSYAQLMDFFGPAAGQPTPPSVSITIPNDGAQVLASFAVQATIQDSDGVASAELYVDGAKVGEKNSAPWSFTAPVSLGFGSHAVEVRGYDQPGAMGSDSISVSLVDCLGDGDCGAGQVCESGVCGTGGGGGGGNPDAGGGGGGGGGNGDPDGGVGGGGGGGAGGEDGTITGGCATGGAGASFALVLAALGGLQMRRRRRA